MSIRADLLDEIEAFLAKHDMAAAALGTEALNDSGFVLRLRNGRNIRIETADRIRKFMREYDPKARQKKAA